jgi:hypothetical protein
MIGFDETPLARQGFFKVPCSDILRSATFLRLLKIIVGFFSTLL